jgi:hypothetical protein
VAARCLDHRLGRRAHLALRRVRLRQSLVTALVRRRPQATLAGERSAQQQVEVPVRPQLARQLVAPLVRQARASAPRTPRSPMRRRSL